MNIGSSDYLHKRRDIELQRVLIDFPSPHGRSRPTRVLDVGAGTGFQAAALESLGYEVVAVDVPGSSYVGERMHDVIDYDGQILPVRTASVDVVFSSNVLEHISHIGSFLDETRRVLAPGGLAIHIMPTPAWRWWTTCTHYGWVAKRVFAILSDPKYVPKHAPSAVSGRRWRRLLKDAVPSRHGERGMTLTEPYYYRRRWWCRTFETHGFEVVRTYPTGLFYTGSSVFATRLSIELRRGLASWLGSACRAYILRPHHD
jgi:SAM-dependent methyltransferase